MKLSAYVNGLTEDTTPAIDDLLMTYDTSAAAIKKATVANLLAAIGAGVGADGWAAADAMTYAAADAPTFTMTCSGDQTGKYYPGMRVKLTQTTVKYFIITAVSYGAPNTTLTLYGGTDYTLANEAITNPYYSSVKAPAGFPLDPAKWMVEVTDTSQRTQASPASNTWYNLGTDSIAVPIGVWKVSYQVCVYVERGSAASNLVGATLSTANNSESDAGWTSRARSTTGTAFETTFYRERYVTLTTKATYYLNEMESGASATNLISNNGISPLFIRAVCAYL